MEGELLDDHAFARLWVEDRLMHHPLSRYAVERELAEKGIEDEVAQSALEEHYPPSKEKLIAAELAKRRIAKYSGLEKDNRIRRTVSFLTRRGFSVSVAKATVLSIERSREADGGSKIQQPRDPYE